MTTRDKLLLETAAWKEEILLSDKGLFERLSTMHQPNILWIGSVDSLIPVREVTNTDPGEILVYRNIANQVSQEDPGLMALLEDALEMNTLELIVICGYSHCGGIRDVLLGCDDRPNVKKWLTGLHKIYEDNMQELEVLEFDQKERRLSELNIKHQILALSQNKAIQKSWKQKSAPLLLGWYFDLDDGTFTEIFKMEPNNNLHTVGSVLD
jgi:carbonic anhydrase